VEVDPGLLRALRDSRPLDEGWRHFFAAHGL
jgi:hypothetical protein